MNTQRSNDSGGTRRRGPRAGRLPVALLLTVAVAGAHAQYQIQQTGRLFDANPQIGSGGYNAARPVSPLALGNALAQGTIGRGMSLRGVSPIGDPTAFRGPLGSGMLSAFRRDSVSMADVSSPYAGLVGLPYYDPSQTVATGGFLSGQYGPVVPRFGPQVSGSGPAGSAPGVPGPLDLRLDTRLNVGSVSGADGWSPSVAGLRSQIVGLTPGGNSELSSTIFGPAPRAAAPFPAPRVADRVLNNLARLPVPDMRDLTRPGTLDGQQFEEPPGSRPPLGTPLDAVRRGEARRLTEEVPRDPRLPRLDRDRPFMLGPQVRTPGPTEAEAGRSPIRDATTSAMPRLRDASVLPGYDVFTDMQLGLALAADPSAAWFKDIQDAVRQNPAATGLMQELAAAQSQEFIARVVNAPIRTFHGQGESPLNNEILKAESLLEIGQYYEAVRRYEAARRLDPLNPLPLIGKGNAYLAAGEYLSAVVALVQGFERYPELSKFSFDLAALMGGGEVVDIRRSDLMRRLESQEDPRLRFLLGYLEYFGGDRESGLKNFEKAAETDAGASIISRFPAMLREGRLPPPKLPGATPVLPEEVPGRTAPGSKPPGEGQGGPGHLSPSGPNR
jgi:hypothetical protein